MASQIPITVRAQPAAASSAANRGKKRPGSPAVSAASQASGSGNKKKKGQLTTAPATQTPVTAVESVAELKAAGSADVGPLVPTESTAKPPPFKDPNFMGLVEQQQGKRTGPGKISNRSWLWSGRYPGSSMILTTSVLTPPPPCCQPRNTLTSLVCLQTTQTLRQNYASHPRRSSPTSASSPQMLSQATWHCERQHALYPDH
ncbi:INO80 complex subunit C isoform X2 [Cheilinus undulatus]|uniref:INO80 complex subunit C isoform X2 n=1 Tax=Cheilinus undulatus TaxID=241271 RepID=UPI001BD4A931|nr:INO80 complex subunit C isoform X2 [Cheilinus undulatus]